MLKNKFSCTVLCLISILCIPISFSVCCIVADVDTFGVLGIVRYSWIMLLFVPVDVLLMLLAAIMRTHETSCRKEYQSLQTIAIISAVLLILMGIYSLFPKEYVSYTNEQILAVEEKTKTTFPDTLQTISEKRDEYIITYSKIKSEDEKIIFENEISNSDKWTNDLDSKIKNSLPQNIQYEIFDFDYFMLLNIDTGEYNSYPEEKGSYNCIFVAYGSEDGRIFAISGFTMTDS